MSALEFKRGTAPLRLTGIYRENDVPVDIAGWVLRCQLRAAGTGALVEELVFSAGVGVGAFVFTSAGSTNNYPLGKIVYDIEFSKPGGLFFSEDGEIHCVKPNTLPRV